ncbi:MAG: UDP-N-acetyl-D-glucosamine 6-dehydrogenase [Alphaproteobacteria bacterium MarineAlpha5_Bin11]|nr:MAG: UDP-N-acetyl-D-glucosamine 6-dehydrogenase [Alphaproteobacteria bacterium MarineAlpha5_Bin11]|tara:strand:+ start:10995 stop:12275 length:1281 start_codon:yes stop_codon:yes gene_type:complete
MQKVSKKTKIGIIGLGYVGLNLAIEFSKKFNVVGFEASKNRISELKNGVDKTKEVSKSSLLASKNLFLTNSSENLRICNVYIITVPTPINSNKKPDLKMLLTATKTIGGLLKKGNVVIYESTVYPGATEEECIPVLEKISNLKINKDFYCGYSPERINPGDKKHKLIDVVKLTSGSNKKTANFVDLLYSKIIRAGTYMTSSIRVAEAAKVIENTQRDLNIALVNEFSIIFNSLDLDTGEILNAAKTKWNFLNFYPGLVGGHCISVDPYYLTFKSQQVGYNPKVILSGRYVNDQMGVYVAKKLIKQMKKRKLLRNNNKILLMGIAFKENCPDIRNSRVFDIIKVLTKENLKIEVYDPVADTSSIKKKSYFQFIDSIKKNHYDSIIIAVAHDIFKKMGIRKIRSFGKKNSLIYDLKSIFNNNDVDFSL